MTTSLTSASALGRAANRAKRQFLSRFPPARWAADGRHEERRRRWAPHLPPLDPEQASLVSALHRDAIRVGPLEDLAVPGTTGLLAALEGLTQSLAAVPPRGASTVRPTPDDLLADLSVWHWGLQDRLLDVVENYLGVPARYYGADVRREVGDSRAEGVRQWHRDAEDRRTVKVLVWLNDVDEAGGPYAYLPLAASLDAVDRLGYVAGFVDDRRLGAAVPEATARLVTGPRWTAIVADNCRLLHRATPPVARDRFSVTYTWSSRTPVKTEPAPAYTPAQRRRIRSGLSRRQLECLPPALRH
ncbi:hypothetical protein E7744_07645 [Citricoccus sp. SGAir0253]|uniref:hypothetical protein n=1 Tax=Citricoccus sp. SGAir0253 TaxID=2567881 RepID=UPI0010CCC26A|nr:hypothetical protein [Citricoccus sp. SGAir0253]QCU78071.1 hypothetical protein E7744_07645 [Citricoccus sp. SGAir0253]